MKLFLSFTFLLILIAAETSAAQPQLIAPPDNSEYQKTIDLELQWEETSPGSVYEVQYSTDSTFNILIGNLSLAGNIIVLAKLQQSTIYYWRVRVSGEINWSEVWRFKTTPPPAVPQPVSPLNNSINIDKDQLFKWSGSETNARYLLQLSKDASFAGELFNYITEDTFYTVKTLSYLTTYYWRVKGINVDNVESAFSDILEFKTRLAPAALVSPADNIINADTSITFLWGIVNGASRYKFQLAVDSLFSSNSLVKDIDTISNQLKIDSLSFYKQYYWRVSSTNVSGDSGSWSAVNSLKTKLRYAELIAPENQIRNLDTVVVFIWQNVDSSENYDFQLSTDSLFSSLLINNSLADTLIDVDSLLYNTKYFWRVRGKNSAGGESDWIKFSFKTILVKPLPAEPSDSSKNILPVSTLKWNNIAGADSYRVQIAYDSLFNFLFVDSVVPDSLIKTDSLLFDTTYFWRVSAFNAEGDSSRWSVHFRFKTRPAILFSRSVISDTINLSVNRIDTLRTLSVSNYGNNLFVVDSIKVIPDSLFTINKQSTVIEPGEEEFFKIKFINTRIDTGLTEGFIHFIRNNTFNDRDTLTVPVNVLIFKAAAVFSDSALAYDSVDAVDKPVKDIIVSNKGGNIRLRIDSIAVSGQDTATFKVINDSLLIEANDSAHFYVEFKPRHLGYHSASISVYTNSFPDSLLIFPLSGYGRGGELASSTLLRVEELSDSLFEAFSENDKPLVFKNTGNAPLNIKIEFAQNNFTLVNEFQKNITVKRSDSALINIRYTIPDFSESKIDTMRIIHNGFGEDTLIIYLEGTFDSAASANKIQNELRMNGNQFSGSDIILNENTPLNFTLNPVLLNGYDHLNFKVNYYRGGHGDRISAENDGSFNYKIPKEYLDHRGLLFNLQLTAKGKNNKLVDSIDLSGWTNIQSILKEYKTIPINVPRSIPAEKPEDANVKWIMFGFPFEEVVADTLFKDLGGTKNMKDGEWIIYKYDFTVPDSFSVFSGYSLQPNTAYFAAQSIKDTLKLSYTYKENLRTRKLTDTILTVPGTNWKTIVSPFLFDVEVVPPVILRRYDTNNKIYKMTNIMKPGEGYFVDPSFNTINVKTYGKYNPLFYPAVIEENGWYLSADAANSQTSIRNYFSISNNDLSKSDEVKHTEYAAAPRIERGLNMYILNSDNEQLEVSLINGTEGASWDLILLNDKHDDHVNLSFTKQGNFPKNFNFKIFDENKKEIISDSLINYFINKNNRYKFKVIIGTANYIEKTLNELSNNIPDIYYLSQNYPNPFNPETMINYQLPENGFVSLKIYDALGAEVATLLNEYKTAGYYKINFNGSALASGAYFCRLVSGDYTKTIKMLLLK